MSTLKATSLLLAAGCLLARPGLGQQLANGRPVPAGDPTLISAGDHCYMFSSGPGGPIYRSRDLFVWEPAGRLFTQSPAWVTEALPQHTGYIWAPDIVKIGDEYRAYWSTSSPGSRRSVIGFASNRTLDPASPDYRWVDRGKIIETFLTNDWNAIDPQCFVDQQGKAWLAMGSYWTGLKLRRLDKQTGHLSAEDKTLYSIARRTDVDPPALEGAYIVWREGYYYLFVSFDRCHLGVESNYNIRVGRSRQVTGPYTDRAGRALMDSGGTLIFESQGEVRGPGHNSVVQHNGKTWIAFHYFNDPARKGSRVLQIRSLTWDAEGWPKVGEPVAALNAADVPDKKLPLPGEVFAVEGRPAFLIPARNVAEGQPKPWVWYAPTLPGLPAEAEKWMFEQFTEAGIAIAGIDVGESYGSPVGRELFTALYNKLTAERGYARKPVLLGRSRGGLMTLNWAAENADKVAAFAGIYPVCNLASYPGLAKAAPAYKLTPEELTARLAEFNPVDRLAPLAKAGVPLFAIHGDTDKVVPLELNSGLVKSRYEALNGAMVLIVPKGQGHNMWEGFFRSEELVAFVKKHCRP